MSMQSDFLESLKRAFKGLKKKTRRIPRQAHDLQEALALLKQREKRLQEKLKLEHDEKKRGRLKNEIEVIHQQRMKGVQLLKDLHGGNELPEID